MTILDDRGRLFGRINIIDAAVLAIVGVLIPLVYAAYLLFRMPEPRLVGVEPARVRFSEQEAEVTVRGEYLRPYLRFALGTHVTTFLFEAPDRGIVRFLGVPPGSYDVVLYDASQELGRLPNAVTVDPPPPPPPPPPKPREWVETEVLVVGAFEGLNRVEAQALTTALGHSTKAPRAWGRVMGFAPPEIYRTRAAEAVLFAEAAYQVSAVLQLRCELRPDGCRIGDVVLARQAGVPLDFDSRPITFRVQEVHPVYTDSVEIVVRCSLTSQLMALLRGSGETGPIPALERLHPRVMSITPTQPDSTDTVSTLVRLRVPAVKTADTFFYRTTALRIGENFEFETPLYLTRGTIVAIEATRPRATGISNDDAPY